MASARSGSGVEPVVTAVRLVDLLGGSASVEFEPSRTANHEFSPASPAKRGLGSKARPRLFGDHILLKRRTTVSIPTPMLDAASYRVRLVDPDGRTATEIPLLSVDVAGALREVCLHSPDRSAYELWRGDRLILKAFRTEIDGQVDVRTDTQDGPHRGLSGSH